MPIRKIYYSILINKFESKSDPVLISEYLRHGKQIKIYQVKVDESITAKLLSDETFIFKNLFFLNDTLNNHLCSSFKCDSKLKYYFSALYAWIQMCANLDGVKTENFKRAFIVSLIKSCIYDKLKLNSKSNGSNLNLKLIDSNDNEKLTKEYLNNIENHNLIPDLCLNNTDYIKDLKTKFNTFISGNNRIFNLKLIHCLCQYQTFYLSINCIQDFLDATQPNMIRPLKLVKLGNFFNASFLHNFITELDRRVQPG